MKSAVIHQTMLEQNEIRITWEQHTTLVSAFYWLEVLQPEKKNEREKQRGEKEREYVSLHLIRFDLFTPEMGQYFIRTNWIYSEHFVRSFRWAARLFYFFYVSEHFIGLEDSYHDICRTEYAQILIHLFDELFMPLVINQKILPITQL